jgi:hypothetical protein
MGTSRRPSPTQNSSRTGDPTDPREPVSATVTEQRAEMIELSVQKELSM